ncbi:MAG: VacJ family lipoprotein [Deltaproteobacteria bacterium]|nr:VacJ family lipoprotein [Deltaproteobacteria bacterium]
MTAYCYIIRFLARTALVVIIGIAGFGILFGVVSQASAQADPEASEEYDQDPWEPFNESNFEFNRKVDLYALKPIATGYDAVLPDLVQTSIKNAIKNLGVVRRLVNNLLQLKFDGAGRELLRFTINSTIGIVGIFDVARDGMGIKESDEDTGQTLGFYGVGPGPYLVLPLLPPMNVRDGLGSIVDRAMNPINYLIPFAANADPGTTAGGPIGITVTDAIKQRSLNLETFEGIEEAVIDLYSAVRNGYQQKREAKIKE